MYSRPAAAHAAGGRVMAELSALLFLFLIYLKRMSNQSSVLIDSNGSIVASTGILCIYEKIKNRINTRIEFIYFIWYIKEYVFTC